MWNYTIHDLVIRGDLCNLRCQYCALAVDGVPIVGREGSIVGQRVGGRLGKAEDVSIVASRVRSHVKAVRESCDYPLLKVSGGELTVVREWVELLFALASDVPALQLLTNGTALSRRQVERLALLPNFILQVSLDGDTAAANRFRGLSQDQVNRALAMIEFFLDRGVDVEINAVLTRANLKEFPLFAKRLSRRLSSRPGRLVVNPRPVRGPGALSTRSEKESEQLREALARSPAEVLPSPRFLDRILTVLEKGNRSWPCFVPFYVLGTQDHGGIEVCTCGPHLGSAGKVTNDKDVFSSGSRFEPESSKWLCTDCVTQYEVFNMFFVGSLLEDDMLALPTFRIPAVLDGLRATTLALQERLATMTVPDTLNA